MPSQNYLVGFFLVEGHGNETVETPLTGKGAEDYQTLWAIIRGRFPSLEITKTGSTIETRDSDGGETVFTTGATIQQLFQEDTDVCSRNVGRVEFDGKECEIILRFHRGRNVAGVNLIERETHSTIRFSDTVSGMQLASDLPKAIAKILGQGGKKLNLRFKEVPGAQ